VHDLTGARGRLAQSRLQQLKGAFMIRVHKMPAWHEMNSQSYAADYRELCRIYYSPKSGQFGRTGRGGGDSNGDMDAVSKRVVYQVLTRGSDSVRTLAGPSAGRARPVIGSADRSGGARALLGKAPPCPGFCRPLEEAV